MGSVHETAFVASAAEAQLDNFGQDIVYTPKGGSAVTVTCIIQDENKSVDPDDKGTRWATWTRNLRIPRIAMGTYTTFVADPLTNASFTYNGDDYAIVGATVQDTNWTNVTAKRQARREISPSAIRKDGT